jgi:general secretion pathway protein D
MPETTHRPSNRSTSTDRGLLGSGRHLPVVLAFSLALGACSTDRFVQRPPAWGDTLHDARRPIEIAEPAQAVSSEAATVSSQTASRRDLGFYQPGSGVMARPAPVIADARPQADGDVKLNFQNANLLEVIKVVLGDMLGINYIVDPTVQGTVSMQTTDALRRADLIPTLELLLRMNNAALITSQGVYRVVPLANAMAEVRAPQLGDSTLALPGGFSVRVVPLRYVAAEEMAQILDPFVAGSNQLLRVDSARNLLILAGNGSDMERLLDTVRVFDVDRMAGMSVALFTPEFVDATTLAGDLESLLADPQHGLMAGLVRFIVVERLNGLMVVTPRAEHLARVREWIQRLDRDTGDASPRLFIYRVQNGKATDLAEVLTNLFNPEARPTPDEAELAPGLERTTIRTPPPASTPSAATTATNLDRDTNPASPAQMPAQINAAAVAQTGGATGIDIEQARQVQVIADEPNNALLILARGSEYRQILTALRQLDVSPLQVLVEVTIAEVELKDNLSFGVEWFFKNNFGSKTGEGLLDLGTSGLAGLVPGFSYALKGPDVRFVLNTLATESNLSVISSPSLLVLNNQEATINVGEEVPVATEQRQSTIDPDAPIINSVDYRDTGVLLTVKPRVNAGGLVIMEVEQEVSQAPSTSGQNLLTPRIRQRKIASTVAVNSGDTIILGGLIEENRDLSESGVPGFHKVPILGALFGTKTDNQDRTELIVLITPRAVSNGTAALQVTEQYRRRLQRLIPSRGPANAGDNRTGVAQPPQATGDSAANP